MALWFFFITSRYYFIEFQSRFYIDGVSTYEWESSSVITLCCLIIVGECKSRFTSRKVPYCIKYHPEEDKQHLFVAGTSDKKIVCVSDLIHANSFIQHFPNVINIHNVNIMLTIYNLTTPWASLVMLKRQNFKNSSYLIDIKYNLNTTVIFYLRKISIIFLCCVLGAVISLNWSSGEFKP